MSKKPDIEKPENTVRLATVGLDAVIVGPDGKISPEVVKQDKARELLALYDETGDGDYIKAARILVPGPNNREPIDDSLALRRARELLLGGYAKTPYEAACIVAIDGPGHSLHATITRLRGKFKIWSDRDFAGKPPPLKYNASRNILYFIGTSNYI